MDQIGFTIKEEILNNPVLERGMNNLVSVIAPARDSDSFGVGIRLQ